MIELKKAGKFGRTPNRKATKLKDDNPFLIRSFNRVNKKLKNLKTLKIHSSTKVEETKETLKCHPIILAPA